MKNLIKYFNVAAALLLLGGVTAIHAQQRTGGGGGYGGGGGGFGGFGLFGGGGFNNFNRNGGSSGSTTSAYNNNGTVGSATISVDPDTHNIVVIADEQTSDQISNVIANLDAPKPQVLIKVVFMEVDLNKASAIGVQGSYTGGSLGSGLASIIGFTTNYSLQNVTTTSGGTTITTPTLLPSGISPTYQSFNFANNFGLPQTLSGATGNGGLYQVLGNDFNATLQAIATAGKAQVLSRPSILARDGQLAQIVVGQQIYLPSGVSFTAVGTGSSTIPTINGSYQNVGIILNVTPYIGDNNLVEMIVQPQTSSVDTSSPGQVIATGGLLGTPIYAPNLDIRSADTVVMTPDAQPVVIGGLISSTKSSAESKVPILGDIPLLGDLFKFTSKADAKTELLIFLTPHIVQTPSQLAPMSARERSQTPAINSSVSEQELDQFLERVPMKKSP
jgi:general secretion pathway protein D